MQKQAIQDIIDELPEEIDVDAFLDRLILLEKLQAAEERLKAGEGVSHEEARQRLQSWLK